MEKSLGQTPEAEGKVLCEEDTIPFVCQMWTDLPLAWDTDCFIYPSHCIQYLLLISYCILCDAHLITGNSPPSRSFLFCSIESSLRSGCPIRDCISQLSLLSGWSYEPNSYQWNVSASDAVTSGARCWRCDCAFSSFKAVGLQSDKGQGASSPNDYRKESCLLTNTHWSSKLVPNKSLHVKPLKIWSYLFLYPASSWPIC